MAAYSVPYGKDQVEFDLPHGMTGTLIAPNRLPAIDNVQAKVESVLDNPVNSCGVQALARKGDRICIVFTDLTRACPDHMLLPPLLTRLELAGVRDRDITLLCGVGTHRPTTREEKIAKLGQKVVNRYHVVDHESRNPDMLVDLGTTESGIPLSVNKIAYEADLLMATGIVEPHQLAGYSGGPKTVAVGAAGESMIAYTHSPRMVDHPGTRLGRLQGNPFHEAIVEAARRAKLQFVINIVADERGRVLAVQAGEPKETLEELVKIARTVYEVPVPGQYDVVIGGVGHPKDTNLYQASRAPTYLYFAPVPVIKPGGIFIIPAQCPEGVGHGSGEQRFLKEMKQARDIQSLLEDLRGRGYSAGGQRAFFLAKVLEKNDVIIVGCEDEEVVSELKMIPASDMNEAFQIVTSKLGSRLDGLIVPHALLTLPVADPSLWVRGSSAR